MNIFNTFKMCAGLKINLEKAEAKYIGSLWNRLDPALI